MPIKGITTDRKTPRRARDVDTGAAPGPLPVSQDPGPVKSQRRASFVVPGDVNDLSPNQRLHYYERHRRSQRWKQAAYFSWHTAGCPCFTGKVRITFTVRRGRKLDPDNAAAGCKALLDGLKRSKGAPSFPAMIADDSSEWVELAPVVQECGKRWKGCEEVRVEVEEISGD